MPDDRLRTSADGTDKGSQGGNCLHICTLRHGLSDAAALFQGWEHFCNHLEASHHVPVPRGDETADQAAARFVETYPEAIDCMQCKAAGAPWARAGETC